MSQAVARTLTGNDVILLSGGLDSPTVAAFGAPLHLQLSGQPLTALSHVYPEYPTVDERPYIELVVKQLGLPFHTYVPETTNLSSLQEWVHDLDGPWQGWVPFGAEEQFRVARELGFSSILTGELAEFVFDRPKHLISHLLLNGRPAAALRHLSIQRQAGATLPVLARQVLRTFIPRPLMVANKRIRPGITLPDWLDASLLARQQADRELPARERWNDQQTSFLQGAGLSMEAHSLLQIRAGVRMRSPWADVDLWEFFLSLPAQVKYPDHRRKGLVRELMRGRLPDAIVDRADKTVFTDFVTADIDYPSLRRWLLSPAYRLKGVDYAGLANRLETGDLDPLGYIWAKDLAIIHAFLALW
jgi:asparagine synthase (glutamine-hydrolysing)